jgi:hypothetical protein
VENSGFSLASFDLLNRLKTEGESLIQNWVWEDQEETLHLEFKTKAESAKSKLSESDKQNIGKSLSGFSNAEGGITVWGVATTKNENGIDKASELKPIKDVGSVLEVFKNQISQSLSPENAELQVFSVKCIDEPNFGYIIVAIPKGSSRPHMSVATGHHKYYRRTIYGSQPLEHYEVVDMFRAEIDTNLELRTSVSRRISIAPGHQFALDINSGDKSAELPYFFANDAPTWFRPEAMNDCDVKVEPPHLGDRVLVAARSPLVLLPTEWLHTARLNFYIRRDLSVPISYWGEVQHGQTLWTDPIVERCSLRCKIGSKNGSAKEFQLVISADRIFHEARQLLA